jgi:hypothetical protein
MAENSIGSAVASPTKAFFVRMLTRDIELQDAILDLLDNCVDGIIRSSPDADSKTPYAGFEASIILSKDRFKIEDNCGGIPFAIAQQYAFAIGKPDGGGEEEKFATVGMYGIGLKRAIFKMGSDAIVESRHDRGFSVEFTPEWMRSEGWENLPMLGLAANILPAKGTSITVSNLHDDVQAQLSNPEWIEDFKSIVARHFSLIIAKGFTIYIGDDVKHVSKIVAEPFYLLRTEPDHQGNQIAPYAFKGALGDVDVEIYAGLYRKLADEKELELEEETRGSKDDAGWTIVCNDRVVVWKDKTRLTGWGESSVPNFHGQFIAITGIVLMHTADPKKLPLTTTKRGVDASLNIYSEVKDLMREATKALTRFTNAWKKFPEGLETLYRQGAYVGLDHLRESPDERLSSAVRKFSSMRRYAPSYPEPPAQQTDVVVRFTAKKNDIALLAQFYTGDEGNITPSEIGSFVFQKAVEDARGKRR